MCVYMYIYVYISFIIYIYPERSRYPDPDIPIPDIPIPSCLPGCQLPGIITRTILRVIPMRLGRRTRNPMYAWEARSASAVTRTIFRLVDPEAGRSPPIPPKKTGLEGGCPPSPSDKTTLPPLDYIPL